MRSLLMWPIAAVSLLVATLGTPPVAADEAAPKKGAAEAPKQTKLKRVIRAIEIATSKDESFRGAITLELVGSPSALLTYHWGGACKGTKVTSAELTLLYQAMRDQLAVEIPGHPISHEQRITMCMRSVRIINE